MFHTTVEGRPAAVSEVFAWERSDRLGVVVTSPMGGMGASLLIQLAVFSWYSQPGRKRRDPIAAPDIPVLNPDIFLFHVGGKYGNHCSYDFWPERKEVFLPNDAPAILDAINDRAITHLLVPDGSPQDLSYDYMEP